MITVETKGLLEDIEFAFAIPVIGYIMALIRV